MKIKFYGTRGSVPICHPDYMEFGGNTTSFKVTQDNGRTSIFDAGTGIRNLGRDLIKDGIQHPELFIGFSHFHWDHIQGLPFFDPAYNPEVTINILAMIEGREISDLQDIFKGQMQPEYFPVPLESMGAKFNFLLPKSDTIKLIGTSIRFIKQNHPGGSYGYRIEENGKCLVICTDLEHGQTVLPEIVAFCKNADLLVHEAQYTSDELVAHRGWGHSSFDQALEVAEKANVKKLAITHHDPDHNDAFLNKIEKECQQRFTNCVLAREQMEIELH